jgi:uncharacterized protein YndB with AHSA1/START domain
VWGDAGYAMMTPMQLTHTATFEATAAEVYAMLTDPGFRERAAAATGVISAEVSVEESGGGHVVTVDQVQPTDGVPSFAKKFAGETTRAVQTETWSSPTRADLSVRTPGRPTEISGTLTLEESGGTTTKTFTGEVKVKVPLIGSKLEVLMADLVTQGMDTESETGVAWLAGQR